MYQLSCYNYYLLYNMYVYNIQFNILTYNININKYFNYIILIKCMCKFNET